MPASPPHAPRRLRVLQAVYDGDWELYRHFRQYLLIALAWAGVSAVGGQFLQDIAFPVPSLNVGESVAISEASLLLQIFGSWALSACVLMAVGRTCLRSMISGENPTVANSFRLRADFWRFARTGMTLVLAGLLPLVAGFVLITDVLSWGYHYISTLFWLGPFCVLAAVGSFSLALPISATTRRRSPFRTALAISKGQRLRFCAIVVIGASPIPIASYAIDWSLQQFTDWLPIEAIPVLLVVLVVFLAKPLVLNLCVVALAGALSSAYLQLAGAAPDRGIASVFD